MSNEAAGEQVVANMHELNKRLQAQPGRRLEVIAEFYGEVAARDRNTADAVMIMRSIVSDLQREVGVQETEHLKAASHLLLTAMIIMALVGFAVIGAGFYAFYLHLDGQTELNVLGLHLRSNSCGVVALVVGTFFVYLAVSKVIKRTR